MDLHCLLKGRPAYYLFTTYSDRQGVNLQLGNFVLVTAVVLHLNDCNMVGLLWMLDLEAATVGPI
jgi:hypothetical protein